MQIDDKLIDYLEDLSYFTLSDKEKELLKDKLQNTFNDIELIKNLTTGDIPEYSHNDGKFNVFRNDEVCPSYDRELILKNAPFKNEEMFIAPKTLE